MKKYTIRKAKRIGIITKTDKKGVVCDGAEDMEISDGSYTMDELYNLVNNLTKELRETVICSAIKYENKVVRGHRHSDCVQTAHRMGITAGHTGKDEGFITSKNRFVDRHEGYKIQRDADIPSFLERTNSHEAYLHEELYSEDLY